MRADLLKAGPPASIDAAAASPSSADAGDSNATLLRFLLVVVDEG